MFNVYKAINLAFNKFLFLFNFSLVVIVLFRAASRLNDLFQLRPNNKERVFIVEGVAGDLLLLAASLVV